MEELQMHIAVLQAHCNRLQEGSAKESVRYALKFMKEKLRKDCIVLEDAVSPDPDHYSNWCGLNYSEISTIKC